MRDLRKTFPTWVKDNITRDMILTDDIDSLMSCIVLNLLKGYEIRYFYDCSYTKTSQAIYTDVNINTNVNVNEIVGVDFALEGYKTWDNHVNRITSEDPHNELSANLNNCITRNSYYSKYLVSTFFTICWYYGIDFTKWTTEQLLILCAIDGMYHPFKEENKRFKTTAKRHFKELGVEFLGDFMQCNLKDIIDIEKDLNLKDGKIKVNYEGYLTTNIDLCWLSKIFNMPIELPTSQFKTSGVYNKYYINLDNKTSKISLQEDKRLLNFVLTFKNLCIMSFN